MKEKMFFRIVLATISFVVVATQAQALTINGSTFSSWDVNETYWALSDSPANPSAVEVAVTVGESLLYELYKSNFDNGVEEKSLAGYYDTVYQQFAEPSADPSGAIITWTGSVDEPYISSTNKYLVVKDGNANPDMYIFDLTSLWNGKEQIVLENFWYNIPGAISHVSLYGNTPVPEPATMLLFGTGLIGLAGLRLRKNNKETSKFNLH